MKTRYTKSRQNGEPHRHAGFTLVELMMVVAVVGILATIALQAYMQYTHRARMGEPLAKLTEMKSSVAQFYATHNRLPTSAIEAGIGGSVATDIYSHVSYSVVSGGPVLTIWVQGAILPGGVARAFSLSGVTRSDQSLSWTCKTGDASGSNGINPAWLPSNCRS
ncbi:MAG: pilin [Parahaliea sp.]